MESALTAAVLWALLTSGCGDAAVPAVSAPHGRESAIEEYSNTPPAKPVVPDLQGVDFVDVSRERGLNYVWPVQPHPMRALDAFGSGCAAFDGDNDGWQDFLVNNNGEDGQLFHNEGASSPAAKDNHWLVVQLVGTKSNRDAIGAHLKLVAGDFKSYSAFEPQNRFPLLLNAL